MACYTDAEILEPPVGWMSLQTCSILLKKESSPRTDWTALRIHSPHCSPQNYIELQRASEWDPRKKTSASPTHSSIRNTMPPVLISTSKWKRWFRIMQRCSDLLNIGKLDFMELHRDASQWIFPSYGVCFWTSRAGWSFLLLICGKRIAHVLVLEKEADLVKVFPLTSTRQNRSYE